MKDWDQELQVAVERFIRRHAWQMPLYDFADLLQEAWLVYCRVRERYSYEGIAEYLGTDDPVWIATRWRTLLFDSIANRIRSLASRESYRRTGSLDAGGDSWGACDYGYAAVDLMRGLERSPRIRRLLEVSSWEDDKARVRTRKVRPDGSRETPGDVMFRLARRRSLPRAKESSALSAELSALV